MRLLELIAWLTCVYSVLGAPRYHRRSLRHPWFRNEDLDQIQLEHRCQTWSNFFFRNEGEFLSTEHGSLSMIIQGKLKLLTWSTGFQHESIKPLRIIPTVVDTRESNLSPCQLFDTTVKMEFGSYPDYEYCDVIMIDRVLWCKDEANMVSGGEIITFYPGWIPGHPHDHRVVYFMCGTMMGNDCIADALVPSIAEPNEAVRRFSFTSTGPG